MAKINPEFSIANIITIFLTMVVALTAWSSVEGQVQINKTNINEAKIVSKEIEQNIDTLTIDVALLKQDAEDAARSRQQIQNNQLEIIKLLQKASI
tara:strand:+ start:4672 stop:4959 length:288 start_codon:yes stop_codon:yes gene_type:complete